MILLSSDWHLIKSKDGMDIIDMTVYDTVIGQLEIANKNDQLIFLGDIFDAEIRPYWYNEMMNNLRERIIQFSNPIFIRGNNDCLSDNFYKSYLGFSKVLFATSLNYKGKSILLSHTSVHCEGLVDYNIHGHIHRPNTDPDTIPYYHSPNNNINLCTKDRREINLTPLENIDLATEAKRNCIYTQNKLEKPGMSQFVQNQVYDYLTEKFDNE